MLSDGGKHIPPLSACHGMKAHLSFSKTEIADPFVSALVGECLGITHHSASEALNINGTIALAGARAGETQETSPHGSIRYHLPSPENKEIQARGRRGVPLLESDACTWKLAGGPMGRRVDSDEIQKHSRNTEKAMSSGGECSWTAGGAIRRMVKRTDTSPSLILFPRVPHALRSLICSTI